MRIALISSKLTEFFQQPRLLADELRSKNHEVVVYESLEKNTYQDLNTPDSSFHVSQIFQNAKNFEIIHYFYHDEVPLTYTPFISTPFVITFNQNQFNNVIPFMNQNNHLVYWTSHDNFDELKENKRIKSFESKQKSSIEQLAKEYLNMYETIFENNTKSETRPWGYFHVIDDKEQYKCKKIVILPQKRLSLQRHQHRAEHWYIIKGKAQITINDQVFDLITGQSIDIPQGAIHRIANFGDEEVNLIEIQTGSYFGEDDIERLEDDYGRIEN